jgi:hypothetical protein
MKNFKKNIPLILTLILGCTTLPKNLSDEDIYDQLEFIKKTDDKNLISYLVKSGYSITYNPDKTQNCIKVEPQNKTVLIPLSYNSNILKEAEIVKAMYIVMLFYRFELKKLLYEVEQLATYKEIEYILSNFQLDEIEKDTFLKKNMMEKICMYILSDETLDKKIKEETERKDRLCRYPLDTLTEREEYYNNLQKALSDINGDAYFNLIEEDLKRRVRNGELTEDEAQKIYYQLISLPAQELYRNQRIDINENIRSIKRFKNFYLKEIKELKNQRVKFEILISTFSECLKNKNDNQE